MSVLSPIKLALVLAASGLHPSAPVNPLLVEDKYLFTDGWSQPCYFDAAAGAFYQLGGVTPGAPAHGDTNVGAGVFASATVMTYRMTSYNSRFDVETTPVEFIHTVGGGGPNNVLLTFANPSLVDAQYDNVRFYRQLPGGNFKFLATVAGGAGTYSDSTLDATLERRNPQVLRRRTTLLPKFRGWVFAQGRLIAWTGLDAILRFSQLRRVDGLGNVLSDFPDDLILPVEPNDGYGPIVAVVYDGEVFYVFKQRAIYRLYGGPDPVDFDIEIVVEGVGCIAQHSIVKMAGLIFFLAEDAEMVMAAGGSPQILAALPDVGASPLEPVWERVNRRALWYVRGWRDVRRGRYVTQLPLDDDPVASYASVLEYRVPGERFVAVDEEVYVCVRGSVVDGGAIMHALGVDDLGNVLEMEYGNNDRVPSGAVTLGIVAGGSTARSIATNGAWSATTDQLGMGFELRDANDVLLERNRVFFTVAGTGEVRPLYYFGAALAAGQKVVLGCIRGYFRTADWLFNDVRVEKALDSIGVQHSVNAGSSLSVSCIQDVNATTSLDAIDLGAEPAGETYVNGKGCRGRTLSFRFENANPDEPWSVSAFDVDTSDGRDRH